MKGPPLCAIGLATRTASSARIHPFYEKEERGKEGKGNCRGRATEGTCKARAKGRQRGGGRGRDSKGLVVALLVRGKTSTSSSTSSRSAVLKGKGRKGKERKGKERKGKGNERKGKEKETKRERKGNGRKGKLFCDILQKAAEASAAGLPRNSRYGMRNSVRARLR